MNEKIRSKRNLAKYEDAILVNLRDRESFFISELVPFSYDNPEYRKIYSEVRI